MERTLFEPEHDLFRESYRKFLDQHVAPYHEKWEEQHIVDRDVWREAGEQGFLGTAVPEEYGGGGVEDFRYNTIVCEETVRGRYSGLGFSLHNDVCAPYFLELCTEEQKQRWLPEMLSGRQIGAYSLSEPQAGSSLADIVTRAEPAGDGSYRVFGSKMWISGGEHELAENIIHLVLAKIAGGPPGVKGISLFIVPRVLPDGSRNDVALAGLNHKMGYRGTVNTVLQFGENGGAIGYLVGEAHQGLAYMFHMMNEARVGVGMGATALGYTGYLKSLDYARTRRQGRRLGGTEVVPLVAHPDVRRMLLAQKAYVEGALALELYCSALLDRERRDLLDILTPVAKSWPSQWCLEANSLAIQVHGGYGYTREYDVEQHYRDNRLNPIHEGTHGIQGLDLLGRKVARQHGLELVGAQIAKSVAAADASDLTRTLAGQLAAVWQQLTVTTAAMFGPGDIEAALANSSVYLEAFGHIVVAWMWLEQAVAAVGRDGDFYDGKRQAAQFFFAYELPKVGPQLDLLAALDRTTLDMRDDWF